MKDVQESIKHSLKHSK